MSVCPNCGAKVAAALKTWSASAKSKKAEPRVFVGLFECPVCKTKFNAEVCAYSKC